MAVRMAEARPGAGRAAAARAPRVAPARVAWHVLALGILLLCAGLHAWRLGVTPGWDPQEGYNLDIAWNLLHGQARLFALRGSFAEHPPLFYAQLALMIRLLGYRIIAVRALASLYAVLTCAALLWLGRRIVGEGAAAWAALVFSVAPLMLDNTRWGYSYAQLACVGVVCLWAAWRYHTLPSQGRLALAATLAGLAAASDYAGVAWIAFVALVALRHARRDALVALLIGGGVLAAELLACLLIAPASFIGDLGATAGRAAGGNVVAQGLTLLLNEYHFLTFDPWIVLGVIGLALVRERRARVFVLGAFALLAMVVLKVRPLGSSFHTAVPLLPLLALGAGAALDLGLRRVYGWALATLSRLTLPTLRARQLAGRVGRTLPPLAARVGGALVAFVLIVTPLGMALASDVAGLATSLPTRQDALLGTPADAAATIAWVRARARPGDLVLASPELAWAFDQPADAAGRPSGVAGADLLQTIAQSGQAAAFYPAGLPPSRWAYAVALGHSRYVIVDNLIRLLATPAQEPALVPLLTRVESWPVVFRRGQYTVYARP